MQLTFVLFEPQVPENIGAAVRALNTMGFDDLRLVNSDQHLHDKARWVAHGSGQLLDNIGVFTDLPAALSDCDLVVGTSAKARGEYRDSVSPEALRQLIEVKPASFNRVALLFGREDRGLSNDELGYCDLITSIPLANPYPSLNLGQAVMLYAYSLASLKTAPRHIKPSKNQQGQLLALKQRVADLIAAAGYPPESKLHRWSQQRLAHLNSEDVHFLHTLCSALERSRS